MSIEAQLVELRAGLASTWTPLPARTVKGEKKQGTHSLRRSWFRTLDLVHQRIAPARDDKLDKVDIPVLGE